MSDTTKASRWTATLAAATVAAMCAGAAHAYTIITRDGHRIEAQSAPEIRGLQAYMRLAPRGQLAVIQEEKIDWARTQAANGKPALIAVPADAQRAEGSSEKPAAVAGPPAQAPGAPAPGSEQAQEAIAKLRAEQARLQSVRDETIEERKLHAAELEALQSRQAGYAGTDNNAERRVQELKDRIAEANAQIGKLESRMTTIEMEVVQLGGSLP